MGEGRSGWFQRKDAFESAKAAGEEKAAEAAAEEKAAKRKAAEDAGVPGYILDAHDQLGLDYPPH